LRSWAASRSIDFSVVGVLTLMNESDISWSLGKQCSVRTLVRRRYVVFVRSIGEACELKGDSFQWDGVRTGLGLGGIGIAYTEDRASWGISMAVLVFLLRFRLSVKLSMLFCLRIGGLYFLEIPISSRRCCNSSMLSDPKILTASSDVTGKISICLIILSLTSNASSVNPSHAPH